MKPPEPASNARLKPWAGWALTPILSRSSTLAKNKAADGHRLPLEQAIKIAQETCRGMVSRRYSLNLQMGLGHEGFDPELNAWASDFKVSESNHRSFYRRWGQLMAAESWTDLQEPISG